MPSPLDPWHAAHPCETKRAWPAVACAPPEAVAGTAAVAGAEEFDGVEEVGEEVGSGAAEVLANVFSAGGPCRLAALAECADR